MRIYDPDEATLQALRETNIELILGAPNEDLQSLVVASTTNEWVQKNIGAFSPAIKFRYIVVGNEVKPTDAATLYFSLQCKTLLRSGSFSTNETTYIAPIISFLASTGAPLLANIYPYFAYISDPKTIDLNYALLTAQATVVRDGTLESVNTEIVVSEAGWASVGVLNPLKRHVTSRVLPTDCLLPLPVLKFLESKSLKKGVLTITEYVAKVQNICALLEEPSSVVSEAKKVEVLTGLSSEFDVVLTLTSFSSETLLFQKLVDALMELESC
ncbi:hypothetical protein Goshw_014890 [Gossypium schwendimanii]|uniref:glucan endo-1,3-beta-D-glucosidase n=1 Tax=Gossypium schwendimanii TaxID=34291 RepID=A0A7J9N1B3_GOSSC|nr:hypothetical protein [Gossypium schwendimanii]